jgi:hypothetical protein
MKKFSNIPVKEKIVKKSNTDTVLEKAISNLELKINSDADNYINKKLEISGKNVLIEKLKSLIIKTKKETRENLFESVKKNSIHFVDVNSINEKISTITNNIYKLEALPNPEDVFSSDDYTVENNNIILNKLEKMPENYYLDYINKEVSNKYFESGNGIKISGEQVWKLDFVPADSYSYDKTGMLLTSPDYKRFIVENKEFIGDFIKSTQMLVGSKNLQLDYQLLNFLSK